MGEVKRVKRDYSELPVDILSVIVGKLLIPSDFVWFGAVCVNWRSALPEKLKHVKLPSLLPVLLLSSSPPPPDVEDNKEEDVDEEQLRQIWWLHRLQQKQHTTQSLYSFYSLYDGKVHDWQLKVHGNCRGSSHGWLVVTTEVDQNYSARLFNPFSSLNNEIELPPLTEMELDRFDFVYRSDYMIKAVLSASPSSTSNPVVMAIHGFNRLSFCKPGDKAWTALPFEWKPVNDVIYYNGLFYAILQWGQLFAIEIDPLHSKLKDIKVLIDVPSGFSRKTYIVESSGELLCVKRIIDYTGLWVQYFTTDVKVFKLQDQDQSTDGSDGKWVEINTLDGRILFLGHNASISHPASDFPGCKPNCIYFTDDNEKVFANGHPLSGPHDMGVYNLEDRSFEPHYKMRVYNLEDRSFEPHYKMQTATITPHPIWIQPTL